MTITAQVCFVLPSFVKESSVNFVCNLDSAPVASSVNSVQDFVESFLCKFKDKTCSKVENKRCQVCSKCKSFSLCESSCCSKFQCGQFLLSTNSAGGFKSTIR